MNGKIKAATRTVKQKRGNPVFKKQKADISKSTSSPIENIISLQKNIGNQAVQRLFESGNIQAKLKIGRPGDKYEQEADRVADQVMNMPEPNLQRRVEPEEEEFVQTKPIAEQITSLVQRQAEEEEEEEEEPVQTKLVGGKSPQKAPKFEAQINSMNSAGRPLPDSMRNYFEPRFGYNFGNVRIHTDSKTVEVAKSLNALALTAGQSVVFGAGQYKPETFEGRKLLAHELAHVVQQSRNSGLKGWIQRRKLRRRSKTTGAGRQTAVFNKFISAFNRTVTTKKWKSANLTLKDFSILSPTKFVAEQKVRAQPEFTIAETDAKIFCGASLSNLKKACKQGTSNPRQANRCYKINRRRQKNNKYCVNKLPTNRLIADYIALRGLTPVTGGPSLIMREKSMKRTLENIVHEGLHRLRGKVWAARSKIGGGFTHTTKVVRLKHIKQDMDEGVVQILTLEVMKIMGVWFKGYSSKAYKSEVAYVRNILRNKGKNVNFLIDAYFADTKSDKVQDLQLWQP